MTDALTLSDADLERIDQAIAARRLRESGLLTQVPDPSPDSFSGRVLARQHQRAAEGRRLQEAKDAAARRARLEHEDAERRRLADAAEQVADLRVEILELQAESRPLEEALAPYHRAITDARRQIDKLTTPIPWDGSVPDSYVADALDEG